MPQLLTIIMQCGLMKKVNCAEEIGCLSLSLFLWLWQSGTVTQQTQFSLFVFALTRPTICISPAVLCPFKWCLYPLHSSVHGEIETASVSCGPLYCSGDCNIHSSKTKARFEMPVKQTHITNSTPDQSLSLVFSEGKVSRIMLFLDLLKLSPWNGFLVLINIAWHNKTWI